MEPHPNTRVLPSNAPALLQDANNVLATSRDVAETLSSEICQNYNRGNSCSACNLQHVCLRCKQHGHPVTDCECGVLRVSSGNAGSSIYRSRNTDLKTGHTQKYEFKHVSSLVSPPHHSAQAAIKAEHPRRQQHPSWSSLEGPPWYWHVEFETERYRQYREKCGQKGSKEVWPDRVEEAFQIAIRIYRRQGRTKKQLNGKQAGGNEFISDFIKQTTGADRDRKKVSSHIQVLKSFLKENRAWMSLVAALPTDNSLKKALVGRANEETACTYKNLEYDDASYQSSQGSLLPFPSRISEPFNFLASSLASSLYPGPTLRRVPEFAMTLEDKRGSNAVRHICTSIQSESPSAPRALADLGNWRQMYPALAASYDQGPTDCPMFLFDAHLSFLEHGYPSNLRISLFMDFSQGAHYTEWRSYPKFYEHNGCPVDLTESGANMLESEQLKGTDNCRLGQISFRPKWWVQVFASLIEEKMMADHKGDAKLIREAEERATHYIRGLSVMQEIWATHRESNRGPQRMAILLWRFDTARRGMAATTSWRKLIPPLSAYDVQSPHPPSENPPMTLDAALEAASPYGVLENPQPSIFSGCPGVDSLSAPLSEESSPSTTPTLESHSFPSSASSSFPSSAANSAYPLYSSQGSSFQSQDSAYPPLGILDSQDPGYNLYEHHELIEASHEAYGSNESADYSQESYPSQEIIYHSQNSLYQHALDQLYEYPCDIADAPVTASASQDFTGGQIHLSYAQTEELQSPYEAPLIAPQAKMVPQHQLIKHPEHYDQHDYLEPNPEDLSGGHEEVDGQAQAQPLPQSYELNELAIDYSEWEDTLRLNPDLESHLSIKSTDETEQIEEQYMMSPVGQEGVEQTQGEVLGEVQEEEGSPIRQVERP